MIDRKTAIEAWQNWDGALVCEDEPFNMEPFVEGYLAALKDQQDDLRPRLQITKINRWRYHVVLLPRDCCFGELTYDSKLGWCYDYVVSELDGAGINSMKGLVKVLEDLNAGKAFDAAVYVLED